MNYSLCYSAKCVWKTSEIFPGVSSLQLLLTESFNEMVKPFIMKIASTIWESPEHLLFAYKISVFNFHVYQLWEHILFASPEIGEKNENINPTHSYTDKMESQALPLIWGQDVGIVYSLAIVLKMTVWHVTLPPRIMWAATFLGPNKMMIMIVN